MSIATRKPHRSGAATRKISIPASSAAGLVVSIVALVGTSACPTTSSAAATTTTGTSSAAAASLKVSPQFLQRANRICSGVVAKGQSNEGRLFPYSDFDPMHPNVKTLPLVGRYFEHAAPGWHEIRTGLDDLGTPTRGADSWAHVVALVNATATNEAAQVRAALASNPTKFVKTVQTVQRLGPELQTAMTAAGFSSSSSCVNFLTH